MAVHGERLYVAEAENNRVSVFTLAGRFLWAFGGGVARGRGDHAEVCRETCHVGTTGDAPGQFNGPRGVTIDSDGDVYVLDEENVRVQKFTPAGRFILMFGKGVNRTTGGDVCVARSGDACGKGRHGTARAAFKDWDAGSFIAVARDGSVYVGDKGRIQIFGTDGRYMTEIEIAKNHNVGSLAIDQEGKIYYAYSQFWTDDPRVYKMTRTGKPLCSVFIKGPTSLAVADDDSIYAVRESGFGTRFEIVHLDSNCGILSRFGRAPKGTNRNSIAIDLNERLYVGSYVSEGPRSYISVYGPRGIAWFRWLTAPIRWLLGD
jgi:hypothetical protein